MMTMITKLNMGR